MTLAHGAPTPPRRSDAAALPGDAGRAAALRAATASHHKDAESRGFVARLMEGELDLAAYTAYLAQLAYVYEALESRASQDHDPAVLSEGSLARLAPIESDLAALGAPDWREAHPALPATVAYVERLASIGAHDVPRFVAHHYTRYLGDLSGGQAIAALMARHYGASADQLAFSRFQGIDSPVAFKRAYRNSLDGLDFTVEEDAALVAEAQLAFSLNAALFDELGELTAAARAGG